MTKFHPGQKRRVCLHINLKLLKPGDRDYLYFIFCFFNLKIKKESYASQYFHCLDVVSLSILAF